jgi:hypothetical protein
MPAATFVSIPGPAVNTTLPGIPAKGIPVIELTISQTVLFGIVG